MHSRFFRAATAALLSVGFIGIAVAHSIWLDARATACASTSASSTRTCAKASPGLLDRLKPEAKIVGSDTALKVDRRRPGFLLRCRRRSVPRPSSAGLAKDRPHHRAPGRRQARRVLTSLGARLSPTSRSRLRSNTLDIVPAGKPGTLQGLLPRQAAGQGQARADRGVGWKREFKTDDRARSSAAAVARRLRRSRCSTPRPRRASWARRRMNSVRCASTLFVRVADGPQGPPQPPVTTPTR